MPSLKKIEERCFSTVLVLTDKRSAISVFVNPSVTNSATVLSRADSGPLSSPDVGPGAAGTSLDGVGRVNALLSNSSAENALPSQ